MRCPRRSESVFDHPVAEDDWELNHHPTGNLACSYCGSISSDDLFRAIKRGCLIIPTDKSYKIYVEMPNPQTGDTIRIGSSHKNGIATPIMGKAGKTLQDNFYFQHLTSHAERQIFLDYYNDGQMKLGYPGYFYVRPYFIVWKH